MKKISIALLLMIGLTSLQASTKQENICKEEIIKDLKKSGIEIEKLGNVVNLTIESIKIIRECEVKLAKTFINSNVKLKNSEKIVKLVYNAKQNNIECKGV